jgi:hypothetical protein
MQRKILIELITALLAAMFAYPAFNKLVELGKFERQLNKIAFFQNWAGIAAVMVPVTEVVIIILLLYKGTRLIGLYASAILLTVFTVYLSAMMIFSPDLPCACSGFISKLSWRDHIVFNLLFTAVSIIGIWLIRRNEKSFPAKYNIADTA